MKQFCSHHFKLAVYYVTLRLRLGKAKRGGLGTPEPRAQHVPEVVHVC